MNKNDYIVRENIKTNIKHFREINHLTQHQIAELMGTDRTTYTKWESGDTLPNTVQIFTLATIFGTSVEEFYRSDNDLSVSSPMYNKSRTTVNLNTLSKKESILIAKYRMLNNEKKAELEKFVEKLRKQ